MYIMTRLLALAILALLPILARSEGCICAQDMVTGFAHEKNGVWRLGRFRLSELRSLLVKDVAISNEDAQSAAISLR
jgi:hypothetical protein